MNRNVLIVIAVVLAIVLGYFGYRYMTNNNNTPTPPQLIDSTKGTVVHDPAMVAGKDCTQVPKGTTVSDSTKGSVIH